MPKRGQEIRPRDVAAQFDWEIGDITAFCADVMEDANDHNMSAALRAVNAGDHELACEFIKLEKDQDAAGHLTDELRERRDELLDRLNEVQDLRGDETERNPE